MTESKFSMEREEAARKKNIITGITKELAEKEINRLAQQFIKESGEFYDKIYPHLQHDGLRKSFILAMFIGTQNIIIKETMP